MKPIFTIHAGEYLVGSKLESKYEVWIPTKDTGVDLLVTNPKKKKSVSIQVKFSKDFLVTSMPVEYSKTLISCGWWTLNRKKIQSSKADLWIFVLYSFDKREPQFVILSPKILLKKLESIHGKQKSFNTYLWITDQKKCWATRDLKKTDHIMIQNNRYKNINRDFSVYLDNWKGLNKMLK